MKDNLFNWFDGNFLVLMVFKVFDLMFVFEKSVVGFKMYGVVEVGILVDYFY